MTTHIDLLEQLCRLCGIQTAYFDIWGKQRAVPRETLIALLGAMGLEVRSEEDLGRALNAWQERQGSELLSPVQVAREAEQPLSVPVTVPSKRHVTRLSWRLRLEDGEERRGQVNLDEVETREPIQLGKREFVRYRWVVQERIPLGYHELEVKAGSLEARSRLIIAPAACYQPPSLAGRGRVWGPAVQLYAARSERDWGIGDFTTLGELAEVFGKLGAGIVGVNPLHALFIHDPERASPYSPSSRLWLNVLYIDPQAMPEFNQCNIAQRRVASADFQKRLQKLRNSPSVDYSGVLSAKREVIDILYRSFRQDHLDRESEYGASFRAFQSEMGESLRRAALCEALQEHLHGENPRVWGWPVWPAAYRDPNAAEVTAFSEQNLDRVEFFEYLQWHAREQLLRAEHKARRAGVALYGDLAVSSDLGGSDVWCNQSYYTLGATVGSPVDDFNLDGQNWGLPPLIPHRLVESRYEFFIALLRQNMRYTGALRIDHVMSVMRLFWIPKGGKPAQGAYIHYPLADLLGIIALESQRNQCLVIGEDLGTVPDQMRAAMPANNLLSYRVLYFEKGSQGEFKPPSAYPTQALVTVTTHDLPTLSGYWKGLDIEERAQLGYIPSPQVYEQQREERIRDRARLWSALQRQSLAPDLGGGDPVSVTEMTEALCFAIHAYVARTPCQVMVFQLEDLLDEQYQVNLPGTVSERPNWRRRLSMALEQLAKEQRMRDFCAVLHRERKAAR